MSTPLPYSVRLQVLSTAQAANGLVRCSHCRKLFPESEIEIDHIVREADGGSHDPANLQVLCAPKRGIGCHRLKTRAEAKAGGSGPREPIDLASLTLPVAVLASCLALLWVTLAGMPEGGVERVREALRAALWLALASGVLSLAARAVVDSTPVREALWGKPVPVTESDAPVVDPARARLALAPVLGDGISVEVAGDGVRVTYGPDFDDHEPAKRLKAVDRLSMKMGHRCVAEWDGTTDSAFFKPVKRFLPIVRHPGFGGDEKWWLVPLSPDTTIDLGNMTHVLVMGWPGRGKTSVMRNFILSAINGAITSGVHLYLGDPKYVELIGFKNWPGVKEVAASDQELWDMCLFLKREMNERYRLFRDEGVSLDSHPPIIFIMDEYQDFVERMEAYWASIDPATGKLRKRSGEREPPPVSAVKSVLRKARKCGIHAIVGTQRADASWFGGEARDNIGGRIGAGRLTFDMAKMLYDAGNTDAGRDIPPSARGRITFLNGDGEIVEDQSYWVPDPANAEGKNTEEDERQLLALWNSLKSRER